MTETLEPALAELRAATTPMTRVAPLTPAFDFHSLPTLAAPPTPPTVPNAKFGTNEAVVSSNEKEALQREIAAAAPNLVPPQFRPELSVQATSRAAVLLSEQGDSSHGNASRLVIGLTGIALLGLISPSAVMLANGSDTDTAFSTWLTWCGFQMASYAAVAALALTVALPGLWILLGLFDIQLNMARALNAVSRAYLRAGLFCLGFVPCILLYCTTGADESLMMFSGTSCYFVAGGVGLFSLALDLKRELAGRKAIGSLLLSGWLCLSMLLGAYLFVKCQVWLIAFEGGWS